MADGIKTAPGDQRSQLVSERVGEGKDDRFAGVMRQYGPALSRLAFGYERLPSVREDLSQEIALAVWQALPHFRGECSERWFRSCCTPQSTSDSHSCRQFELRNRRRRMHKADRFLKENNSRPAG
jgi:Sigma-70 region 2